MGEFQLALAASESLVTAGARGTIDGQTVSLAKRTALKAKVGVRVPDVKELAMKKVAKDISKGRFPFRT